MSTQLSKHYFITSFYLMEAGNTQLSLFISLGIGGKERGRGEEEGPHLPLQRLQANTLLKAETQQEQLSAVAETCVALFSKGGGGWGGEERGRSETGHLTHQNEGGRFNFKLRQNEGSPRWNERGRDFTM